MSSVPQTPVVARRPGQFGREEIRRSATRALAILAALVAAGLLAGLAFGFTSWPFAGALFVVLGALVLVDRHASADIGRRERGAEGEELVGAILDGLEPAGWLTLHDVSLGRGNIDHIAIGPAGIFTIETKSHRGKRRADRVTDAWLSQAYAQCKLVERVTGEPVSPLLVFSHAYLVGQPVTRRRGVVILPARMLAGHLGRRAARLDADEVRALHQRLAVALAPAD